jgi:hypothetical protein
MDDSLLTRIEFGGSWFFEVIVSCGLGLELCLLSGKGNSV